MGRRTGTMLRVNDASAGARLAMLVENAPGLPGANAWDFEFAWAGERVLAIKRGADVRLQGVVQRKDLTNRFPVIAATLVKLGRNSLVLDGVIAAIEPSSLGAFGAPIPAMFAPGGAPVLRLIALDLLWEDDTDTRPQSLEERKARLISLVRGTPVLLPPAPPVGVDVIAEGHRIGAEAVIAKRRQSRYRPYGRNGDWLRIPLEPTPVSRARAVSVADQPNSAPPFAPVRLQWSPNVNRDVPTPR